MEADSAGHRPTPWFGIKITHYRAGGQLDTFRIAAVASARELERAARSNPHKRGGETMSKRGVVLVALAALALGAAPGWAAEGWVVRICRGATEASAIKILVGKPGGSDQPLVNWQSDAKQTDFPVADTLLAAGDALHVAADSEPADGAVAMCVLYNGAPVKAMNVTDKLAVTAARTDKDDGCKCAKGQ
jgi:hypothetical protein